MRFVIMPFLFLFVMSCGKKEVGSYEEFNKLVKQVQKKNEEIGAINKDITDLVHQYNANRKADEQIELPDSIMGLNKDQLKLIQTMVEKEQDLTYRGLLNQIIDKNTTINKMSAEIEDLKSRLPKPYVVKRGDTHEKICLNFLVNEKQVPKDEAMRLIDEVRLIDEMMEGFNVWLYYNEGVFGTFVTQGTARISPNRFNRILRRRQLEAARESGRLEVLNQLRADSLASTVKDTTLH